MRVQGARWGVVLAAGSGTRLSRLTTDAAGNAVPKQFCTLHGGPSLLRRTIARMERTVDPGRVVVVVSARHRTWWASELADLPRENLVIQPCDRGTACGVLLPLTAIRHRDRNARVIVAPSDHYVRNEETLERSMAEALLQVERRPRHLLLLGIKPDHPETEYGWITVEGDEDGPIREVASFEEKPGPERARALFASGALWSSFIFAATADTLLDRFRRSLGWLVDRFALAYAFGAGAARDVIPQLYDGLPTLNFSEHVLGRDDLGLRVLPVPPCGWTDLGSPARVVRCVTSFGCPVEGRDPGPTPPGVGPGSHRPRERRSSPLGRPDLAEAILRSGGLTSTPDPGLGTPG